MSTRTDRKKFEQGPTALAALNDIQRTVSGVEEAIERLKRGETVELHSAALQVGLSVALEHLIYKHELLLAVKTHWRIDGTEPVTGDKEGRTRTIGAYVWTPLPLSETQHPGIY